MQCEQCGGLVTWRGPFNAFTHTECESCGGRNCQVPDDEPEADDDMPLDGSNPNPPECDPRS